jgi:hypothetical protein
MNIAVFADVHGRILLALRLCARWQHETGETIDLILQAGDMNIFPNRSRLDKAAARFAAQDPTELGFMTDFYQRGTEPLVPETLAELSCKLVFVRGNHEDQGWLDELERATPEPKFPVDAYECLWCLKSGEPWSFTGADGTTISVLGIGRIGPTTDRPRQHPNTHLQEYKEAKLRRQVGIPVDVLLTHDAPPRGEGGLPIMRTLLDANRPAYHFYGHIGGPCKTGVDANGTTIFCKPADLHWDSDNQLVQAGSMAIVRWQDQEHHSLEVIDAPWYRTFAAFNWRYA